MPRWEVPYESPTRTLVRYAVATVFTLFALISLSALVLDGPQPLIAWIAVPVFMAAFVTVAWRVTMVGVWIGEQGIKVSTVVRTRLVRWSEFDRVWLGPATGYDALALWISVRDGPDIETPLWRTGTRAQHKNRTKLQQQQLSQLMERLRTEARLNT